MIKSVVCLQSFLANHTDIQKSKQSLLLINPNRPLRDFNSSETKSHQKRAPIYAGKGACTFRTEEQHIKVSHRTE
jgi:hypothetical protein